MSNQDNSPSQPQKVPEQQAGGDNPVEPIANQDTILPSQPQKVPEQPSGEEKPAASTSLQDTSPSQAQDVPEQPSGEEKPTASTSLQDSSPSQPQKVPEQPPGEDNPVEPTTNPVTPTPAPPAAESADTAGSADRLPGSSMKTLPILGGSTGRTCPKCGHVNRPGVLVCEKCSTLMINEEKPVATRQFDAEKVETDALRNATITETAEMAGIAVSMAGSTQFSDNMVLRLEIEGAPTPILLHPKSETSIGRRDPATGTMPDVDLSAYAGYRLGVSRKHAVIRMKNDQLELYDLGSSNGTSVNGERLEPHQPRVLRDGDELVLGKMIVRVLFQMRNRRR